MRKFVDNKLWNEEQEGKKNQNYLFIRLCLHAFEPIRFARYQSRATSRLFTQNEWDLLIYLLVNFSSLAAGLLTVAIIAKFSNTINLVFHIWKLTSDFSPDCLSSAS